RVMDTGLKELQGLKHLKRLYLDRTQVTNTALQSLRAIGLLHVLTNAAAKNGERPSSSADVTRLDLYGTAVTDAGLKELKELQSLQTLVLWRTKVTNAGLKELKDLKSLKVLDLKETKVTDAGLKELKQLKSLQTLDLRFTKVTDAAVKELKKARPE